MTIIQIGRLEINVEDIQGTYRNASNELVVCLEDGNRIIVDDDLTEGFWKKFNAIRPWEKGKMVHLKVSDFVIHGYSQKEEMVKISVFGSMVWIPCNAVELMEESA